VLSVLAVAVLVVLAISVLGMLVLVLGLCLHQVTATIGLLVPVDWAGSETGRGRQQRARQEVLSV
jgi:hypothetical protein